MIFPTEAKDNFMKHVSQDIIDLTTKGEISLETYENTRMNSYEDKYIQPYLSNEAFIWKIQNAIRFSSSVSLYKVPVTYDEYLVTDGVIELLKRFKQLEGIS